MLSLRSISRALPRCLPRLAAQSQPRFLSTIHRTSLLQQTCKATSIPIYAAFSTSRAAREKEGQGMRKHSCSGNWQLTRNLVDQELSAKIESELQLEREMRDSEKLPSSLQDYLDSSSFEVSLHTFLVLQPILKTRSSTTLQAKKKLS